MESMAFIQRDGDPGLAAVARPWVYVELFVLSTGSREILGLLCLPLLFSAPSVHGHDRATRPGIKSHQCCHIRMLGHDDAPAYPSRGRGVGEPRPPNHLYKLI